jgi:hypothetical protein
LIGGNPQNGATLAGLYMANKRLTRFHKLAYATAHADVGLDAEGREVIVMQNVRTDCVDLIPIDLSTKPVMSRGDYNRGLTKPLMRLYYADSAIGLSSGIHISCNHAGYCVISTNTEPGLPEQNWLDRTITLVKLDGSKPQVVFLAKLHNTTGGYWEETQATMARNGSKVVWADNWGKRVGTEEPFLMLLDMPPNWHESFLKSFD